MDISTEQLVANVERLAESGHELMLDPDDENYNEPLDIEWSVNNNFTQLIKIKLIMTTGGPHCEISLPSGKVEGWWGNNYALREVPVEMADQLYEHFSEYCPIPISK